MNRETNNILNFFHPFWTIGQIESASWVRYEDLGWASIYGVPQIVIYVGMTAVFLIWTERTLRFADGEVKFLPKNKNA